MTDLQKDVLPDGSGGIAEFNTPHIWDDVLSFGAIRDGTTAPSFESFGVGPPDLSALFVKKFYPRSSPNFDTVFFPIQFPHSYMENSNVDFHVHWMPDANGDGVDDIVRWELAYSWINIGAIAPAVTIVTQDSPIIGVADYAKHLVTYWNPITPPGGISGISSILYCRLRRIDPGASQYPGNAGLIGLDSHHPKNTGGSRQRITK